MAKWMTESAIEVSYPDIVRADGAGDYSGAEVGIWRYNPKPRMKLPLAKRRDECPHLQTDQFGRCENCFVMLTQWRAEDLEQVTLIRRAQRPITPEAEPKKLVG